MKPIIRVENLHKQYRIGARQAAYKTLRESVIDAARSPFRRLRRESTQTAETIWALKNINFDVLPGEVIGVIGRNGSGKSTLLKILSRITEPTQGRIELYGRVGSLLEVGTGFHPELTGRENIFLNGAILGMARTEITAKFDEIVEFAEIDKFIDTAVKHYSSGMYMRLAFAVAAHLEPEILLVDEVLAVGDAAFQKKCLGKMGDVASEGRTVLFVSHNTTAIAGLCKHGLLLSQGELIAAGDIEKVLEVYAGMNAEQQSRRRTSGQSILRSARLVSISESDDVNNTGVILEIEFEVSAPEDNLGIDLTLKHNQTPICFASSAYYSDVKIERDRAILSCKIGPLNLALGHYQIDARVCRPMRAWIEEHDAIVEFEIEKQIGSRFLFALAASRDIGFVIPPQSWIVKQ